jgi:hypothetical protein
VKALGGSAFPIYSIRLEWILFAYSRWEVSSYAMRLKPLKNRPFLVVFDQSDEIPACG